MAQSSWTKASYSYIPNIFLNSLKKNKRQRMYPFFKKVSHINLFFL